MPLPLFIILANIITKSRKIVKNIKELINTLNSLTFNSIKKVYD